MADWVRSFTGGSYASGWRSRLNYVVAQQSGNSSYVELRQYIYAISGAYSQSGLWDGRTYINGGQVNRNTPNTTISGTGQYLMNASGHWVGHDANGNLTISVGTYQNAPVNDMNHQNISWTLPRIPSPPSIHSITADQIKPTSARLGVEINNHGHGTYSYMRMYYRIQGSGSAWTQTYDQGDAGGYNYWTITGLKPGKVYEYYSHNWNNNGDAANSWTATFKTKGISGGLLLLQAVGS